MAEEHHQHHSGEEEEVKDRGLFDFMGKKKEEEEEKSHDQEPEVLVTEFEKVNVEEMKEEEKKEEKHGILEKLRRSDSSSSSSSEEEEEEEEEEGENKGEKKKKKKKGLKEKIKEKISCEKKEEEMKTTVLIPSPEEDTSVTVEKVEFTEHVQAVETTEDKKGFLHKIKEKIPGLHKKPAEEITQAASVTTVEYEVEDEKKDQHEGEATKEKKGFLGKIMDKIPGYNKSTDGGEHGGGATH